MATPTHAVPLLPRAWYGARITDFLRADPLTVLGTIVAHASFDVTEEQRQAWQSEIACLGSALAGISGTLFLEFTIPRVGHRADAVLLIGGGVFVLEFKESHSRRGLDQVWDYALDLKNFHEASHALPIVPLAIGPGAPEKPPNLVFAPDGVANPIAVSGEAMGLALRQWSTEMGGAAIEADRWLRSPYHPTPTIVEAARALYAGHSVAEIAHSEAAGDDLARTCGRLAELARQARAERRKLLCFVTGVPGAGKTLVGLDLATRRSDRESRAIFLSGNDPLVAVLREALARDAIAVLPASERRRRAEVRQKTQAFIQNVRHFRDEGLKSSEPPHEHVVIFDEAQRAWNRDQLAAFMLRRRQIHGFHHSEPETTLAYMDRHADWAMLVCLVGGGQEIHRGEAGMENWFEAVQSGFSDWHLYLSPELTGREYATGTAMERLGGRAHVHFDRRLHLAVSVRSFRAENVSSFVRALLDGSVDAARRELGRLRDRYPIVLTRNLDTAKRWVRDHSRADQRFGLLATSKAIRLKPHAINVRVEIDPVHWFLDDRTDVRSSFYLEDAATEFQVQGLELDWTCVTWDGDLRRGPNDWTHHDFRGSKWNNIHDEWNRSYVRNAYRVLLTRARQGMAIFIPPGSPSDPTRPPAYYDGTFAYLRSLGIETIH